MKHPLILFIILASLNLHAVNRPVYEVSYSLLQKGETIESAAVVVEEGRLGVVKSESAAEVNSLLVSVKSLERNTLSLDYRYTSSKKEKSIELAKTAVSLKTGYSEVSTFKDSLGNEFQLRISVIKK